MCLHSDKLHVQIINEVSHISLEFISGLKAPTNEDIERLFVVVNKCALSSAILWGMWALIQQGNSTIDFDFKRFAVDRLGMYFAKCEEFLKL